MNNRKETLFKLVMNIFEYFSGFICIFKWNCDNCPYHDKCTNTLAMLTKLKDYLEDNNE